MNNFLFLRRLLTHRAKEPGSVLTSAPASFPDCVLALIQKEELRNTCFPPCFLASFRKWEQKDQAFSDCGPEPGSLKLTTELRCFCPQMKMTVSMHGNSYLTIYVFLLSDDSSCRQQGSVYSFVVLIA